MNNRTLVSMILTVLLILGVGSIAAQDDGRVVIEWFVGLGTGINPDQIPVQEQIVEDFNASQDDIMLVVQFVETGAAIDALSTLIASGNAPDIVGPVGVEGSNAFVGAYLDLEPVIESTGYDLDQFDEQTVDFYRVQGEGLLGLPYAVYPSFLAYNKDSFDEADLAYPPETVGEPYILDGEEMVWDFETLAEVARILTVDEAGFDATEEEFNPDAITEYGFHFLFTDSRGIGTMFGADTYVGEDGAAVIPDQWVEAWMWYHNGIFGDQPFIPSDSVAQSDAFGVGNVFSSGNVAMSPIHLWYLTCCLGENVENFGLGVMPAYEGTTTMKLHADNFRILSATDHPEEAFRVMTYLTDERGVELLEVYGGMTANQEDQPAFIEEFSMNFPEDINWDVAVSALSFADVPSHESFMPNFNEADAAQNAFYNRLISQADLDIELAAEELREELDAIFAEAD